MAKTQYLQFEIHLTDKAVVTANQAAYPNGIRLAPTVAATTYSAPIQEYTDTFVAPCTRSPWFWSGFTQNRPRDVASFTRKSGGWFGLSFLFGTTTTYRWVGKFVYAAPVATEIEGVPTEVVNLVTTTWAHGFEFPIDGETNDDTGSVSRDASRHVDGLGIAIRGNASSVAATINVADHGAGARRASWERFYIRPRRVGSTALSLWNTATAGSPLNGVHCYINPALQLAFKTSDSGGTLTDLATTDALTLNAWHKIDLVFSYATGGGAADAELRCYINGVLKLTVTTFSASIGLGFNGNHISSRLGALGATTGFEIDLDDWTCKPWPNVDSSDRFVGLDWLNGTRIVRVNGTQFGTGNAFTGDFRVLLGSVNSRQGATNGSRVESIVGSDLLCLDLDVAHLNAIPGSLGLVSMLVVVTTDITTVGDHGQLGYRINGGASVMTVLSESTTRTSHRVLYRPALAAAPDAITAVELRYLKGPAATLCMVYQLGASCELVGVFGDEDVTPETVGTPATVPARNGIHNAPYPTSPWARLSVRTQNPVIIHSGTYVGNDPSGQDLVFRCPVNWFFTRKVLNNGDSTLIFSSMMGAKTNLSLGVIPDAVVEMAIDSSFVGTGAEDDQEQRTLVRLANNLEGANELGSTYQYVAVSDPGARFMLNGATHHHSSIPTASDTLRNPNFLALCAWLANEQMNGGATTTGVLFKGPGNSAAGVSVLNNPVDVPSSLTISEGQLDSETAAHFATANSGALAYNLWRKDDGSADPGKANVVQIGSYVGNGAGSRTIGFSPAAGVRPLWVAVMPVAGVVPIYRDPSHTGTVSSNLITGAELASTGIISGDIDAFTVATNYNALGVTYNWFALPGSATAGNGGWSINGEFAPVEPDSAFDGTDPVGDLSIEPTEVVVVDPDPDAGPDDADDCTAGAVCIAATTRQVNVSLLEIGVSQTLTDYCTQTTREARIAQLLYETSVRAVLIATPWPFATKYAALTLAAAQPNNADWLYSYREPVDCLFARRLVVGRGTGVNPEPPPFGISSDASGRLILTNQADAVLEYTARPDCVAFNGDDLFREALKWHLAAALAPALTRMPDEATRCTAMFDKTIEKANAIRKPGVPGLRPAAADPDPDAGATCIAANIQVVNRGLLRIGCQTIASLATDQSRPALAANLILEDETRATLRDYPWKFAKRYDSALVLVDGTATVPANPDWQYSYRLPADYVMVRRLVAEGTGRAFEDSPPPWEVGTDATGDLLFTDEIDPNLEYTARLDCVVAQGDELFRDALAWRIAAALAPSLAQVDPTHPEQVGRGPDVPADPRQRISQKPGQANMRAQATRYARGMYLAALERARIQDANEAEPEDPPDAEWIRGR